MSHLRISASSFNFPTDITPVTTTSTESSARHLCYGQLFFAFSFQWNFEFTPRESLLQKKEYFPTIIINISNYRTGCDPEYSHDTVSIGDLLVQSTIVVEGRHV